MSKNPPIINLDFTSFAPKEGYKPPSKQFFTTKEAPKKQKYIIGGEFAENEQQESEHRQHENIEKQESNQKKVDQIEPQTKSKLGWIKDKKEKPKLETAKVNSLGILEFSEIRADK